MSRYDVTLKLLLQRILRGGVLAGSLGLEIDRWLPTELPRVRNRRVDLLGEAPEGELLHIELQSRNEDIAPRMLEYKLDIFHAHGRYPRQLVLYFGAEPLRMSGRLEVPGLVYECRIVDIRELDGEALLASPDLRECMLAILTNMRDQRAAIQFVLRRIMLRPDADREQAYTELMILSGLRRCGRIIEEETKRMPIILDIPEEDLLGPIYRAKYLEARHEGLEQGREQGLEQGRLSGERRVLRKQLIQRFGSLPPWAEARLESLAEADLEEAALRLLTAPGIEQVLTPAG